MHIIIGNIYTRSWTPLIFTGMMIVIGTAFIIIYSRNLAKKYLVKQD
jgi:ABC-type Fe3+-siderophore transport system permease subunit